MDREHSTQTDGDAPAGVGRRAMLLGVLGVPATAAVAACGGGGTTGTTAPPSSGQLSPPAEPGKAPPVTSEPVGTVVELPGGYPWGIAFDPASGSVAVALRGPGRLAVLDTGSGKVRVEPATGAARMLNIAEVGGPLLYPAENKGVLFEVALPSGEVRSRIPAGTGPHEAIRVRGTTYVADEFGGQGLVIRDGEVVRRWKQPVTPGGIAAAAGRVAVVDVRANLLFVYDVESLRLVATLPAGQGPSHAKPAGGGRIAVTDVRGNAIITYDLSGRPRMLDRMSVPGRAFGLDTDPAQGLVYTTLANVNKVALLRVRKDGTLTEPAILPTVRQPNSLAIDPRSGTVYVAGAANANIQIIAGDAFGPRA